MNKEQLKIKVKEIMRAVFGSQAAFAKHLGISKQNVVDQTVNAVKNFNRQLKPLGLVIAKPVIIFTHVWTREGWAETDAKPSDFLKIEDGIDTGTFKCESIENATFNIVFKGYHGFVEVFN